MSKPIFIEVGLVTFVKCHVYSKIGKEEKGLVAKWDSIEKHASKRRVSNGEWFVHLKCKHAKNEVAYA